MNFLKGFLKSLSFLPERVKFGQVVGRLPVDDPVGQILAYTTPVNDSVSS